MNVTIPDEVLVLGEMTPDDVVAEIAVLLYQRRKASLGKAAELAKMGTGDFLRLLGSRDIPIDYDVDDFRQDVETLRKLRGR